MQISTRKKFLLSAFSIASEDSKNLFIAEPYVYHKLEANGSLDRHDSVEVADFCRKTKEDLISDSQFVDKKYVLYLPLIADRLNKTLDLALPVEFWRKYLSLGFIRYLTAFHDTYQLLESVFNEERFDYTALHPADYIVPYDFEDNRQLFLNSDLGQEQIFSIYLNVKYPGKAAWFRRPYEATAGAERPKSAAGRLIGKLKRLKRAHIYKLVQRIISVIRFKQEKSEVLVGIIGSFFSDRNFEKLRNRSRNTIRNLPLPVVAKNYGSLNDRGREFVAANEPWFDDFDRFFFSSMTTCLPRICVEEFPFIKNRCEAFLNQFPRLKYIVSEAWLSDSYINAVLACAQTRGIQHVYNEHNCIFYPFAGDYVKHVSQLCDIYATVGWNQPGYPNSIPTASLYSYDEPGRFKRKYKILYIGVPFMVKMQHYSAAWGFSEENVPRNIEYLSEFFSTLKVETLSEISYRPYPPQNLRHILVYDKEMIFRNVISKFKEVTDTTESSKRQMKQAGIVVIDYISTSYLECLVMNTPFIFFWDIHSYYLKEEHSDFFAPLIEVGICQTNGVEAAKFIEQIKDDPAAWWFSSAVQQARKVFLDRNLGEPEVMINFLVSLAENRKS